MKQIILIWIFYSLSIVLVGQSHYINQYIPTDTRVLQRALDDRQAGYDDNKKYIDKLIDWIYELKGKTNDGILIKALDANYKRLRSFDNEDLSLIGNKIRQVELEIKKEIDEYNTRLKEENNPKKYWDTGNEYFKNQDYKNAIQNYNRVIELSPEFEYSYLNRGIAYQKLGNLSAGIEGYSKFIQLKPDDQAGYSYRGSAKIQQKDYLGALSDLNKVIELNPTSEQAYYNRGYIKSQLDDQYGAISDYQKAIEINSNFSMAYNNIAWAKFNLKKYTEALVDVNKAIELDNKNFVAYDSRAEIKFNLSDYKGCILDSDMALQLNPNMANPYFLKGRASYRLGEKQKACEFWSKAGELGKAEAYEFIAKYCKN